MAMPEAAQLGYVRSLDGLRAFAVLAVMGSHSSLGVLYFRGGWLGVDVFFVLSGFLITTLILEERRAFGKVALPAFYARRMLRLAPALMLVLAAVTVYALSPLGASVRSALLQEVVAAAVYARNLSFLVGYAQVDVLLSHTWSLGVEEQFYLLWPPALLLALGRGASRRLLLGALALLIVVISAARILGMNGGFAIVQLFLQRPDALLLGCAFAIWRRGATGSSTRDAAVLSVAGWMGLLFLVAGIRAPDLFLSDALSLNLIGLASTLIIAYLVMTPGSQLARALSLAPVVYLGRISYGLYLWHLPVFRWFDRFGPELDPRVQTVLQCALAILVAALSHRFFESRFLAYKARFSRRDGPPVESS